MNITYPVRLPEELYSSAKAEADVTHSSLSAIIGDALRAVVANPELLDQKETLKDRKTTIYVDLELVQKFEELVKTKGISTAKAVRCALLNRNTHH